MANEMILLISMIGSVFTGFTMWWWLKDPLRQMLTQLCDRPGSSDFWARYTLLMLLIAPLSIVVFFSPDAPLDTAITVGVMRRVLLAILLGHFFAFALVGRNLFKAINRVAQPALSPPPVPPVHLNKE